MTAVGRPRDEDGRARISAFLDAGNAALPHREVARRTQTSQHLVRDVRRQRGELAVPIGRTLLTGMHPRHVEALRRLAAAHARGSDMQVRAILGGAEMQQLMRAAEGER